uniref:uncharacterized protein LOC100179575 isoform X2 n=1 Tax=Ciona intestinalis TaxID=7719 RepID=UPI000180B9E4|nr:uncharacterized protein LOC100179575 isoform X2 [Ciona intestinalis]|eukprot:XP_002127235.1 uncharacterized protein LOC100179575 isoform X2 [Ciona intestinalis]
MKFPLIETPEMNDSNVRSNSGTPTRNGRQSSLGGANGRRGKGESIAQAVAAMTSSSEKLDSPNRYATMRKVAEEQRRRVRENRERQIEEDRLAIATRRQEEQKAQIRSVLDGLLVDVRKDILLLLQERINSERKDIKAEMKSDLQRAETGLVEEVEKRVTNGEPFDVQREILSDIDGKIDSEKRKWEESFKREADRRIRAAEDAIRTDFRVGLEDSQKQCGDILSSMQERTGSLEQKLVAKMAAVEAVASAKIAESERTTRQMIGQKMDERDSNLKQEFKEESEVLRQDISQMKVEVTTLQSKCCVIL